VVTEWAGQQFNGKNALKMWEMSKIWLRKCGDVWQFLSFESPQTLSTALAQSTRNLFLAAKNVEAGTLQMHLTWEMGWTSPKVQETRLR